MWRPVATCPHSETCVKYEAIHGCHIQPYLLNAWQLMVVKLVPVTCPEKNMKFGI